MSGTTDEIVRSWPLMSWRERATLTAKAFTSTVGNGFGWVLSAWVGLKVARNDFAVPEAGAMWGVGVLGVLAGVGLYLQRPGLRSMRRRK